MTAQPATGADHQLLGVLADAHAQAVAALEAGNPLDAVVWLSAHVAAGQHTVHRAAGKRGAIRRKLVAARAADHELEQVLRRAEQHHSGDVLAAQLSEGRLDASLRRALESHARAERDLVCGVLDHLDDAGTAQLSEAYDEALRHAPTRPHPHTPHKGVFGSVAFRIDAMRDRMMDTMDGRHVPAPRMPRRPVKSGRWGRYVLGEMEK